MNKIVFLLFFLLLSMSTDAQSNSLAVKNDKSSIVQKQFDASNLDIYKADKDFIYTEETEKKEPTFIDQLFNWTGRQFLRFLKWLFGVKNAQGIFAAILSALPYIFTAIVLLLILRFFLKVNSNSIVETTANKSIVSVTKEEQIKNKDILKLIQQAIVQKNYRLAVRYYYLNILRQLEIKELIVWEQQKTNHDYINEISENNIKISFEELTRLYDFVWYGNFEINEVEFARVAADFEQTNSLIIRK